MKELKRCIVKPYSKDKYELYEPYKFNLDNAWLDEIHAGYKTDGASVPRIFWSLFPPYRPEYFSACVIHDFLCTRAKRLPSIREGYKMADKSFKEALEILEVPKWKIFIFYHWCDKFHALKCLYKGWK